MVLLLSGWENINKKFTKQQVLLRTGGQPENGAGVVASWVGIRPRILQCAYVFRLPWTVRTEAAWKH